VRLGVWGLAPIKEQSHRIPNATLPPAASNPWLLRIRIRKLKVYICIYNHVTLHYPTSLNVDHSHVIITIRIVLPQVQVADDQSLIF
jgi:hypothetical protein